MRKISAHGIRMQKNWQTREDTFWVFKNFHAGPNSNFHPATEIWSVVQLIHKLSIPWNPTNRVNARWFLWQFFALQWEQRSFVLNHRLARALHLISVFQQVERWIGGIIVYTQIMYRNSSLRSKKPSSISLFNISFLNNGFYRPYFISHCHWNWQLTIQLSLFCQIHSVHANLFPGSLNIVKGIEYGSIIWHSDCHNWEAIKTKKVFFLKRCTSVNHLFMCKRKG